MNDFWTDVVKSLLVGLVAFWIAVLLMMLVIDMGWAHDYKHPELTQWYMGLKNGRGIPCCDGQDANHLQVEDWVTQNKEHSHYRVHIENVWVDVPDEAVVDEPNKDPDGQALVWYGYLNGTPYVRCFMPGSFT